MKSKISGLDTEKQGKILDAFRFENLSVKDQLKIKLSRLSLLEQRDYLAQFDKSLLVEINTAWKYSARPKQLPPKGAWRRWVICSGRGWGKTTIGINYIVDEAMRTRGEYLVMGRVDKETHANQFKPIAEELERRGIVFGKSGGKVKMSNYDKRIMRIELPNGSIIVGGSGNVAADSVRGMNLRAYWCDEISSWDDPEEALKQIDLAARKKGEPVRGVITTTPRGKGTKVLRKLRLIRNTVFITGNGYENLDNLSTDYIETLLELENTRSGAEEIWAELIDDSGVLWKQSLFRFTLEDIAVLREKMDRIVVAYDPAITNTNRSAEHGIMVVGRKFNPEIKHDEFYVLADYSLKADISEACQLVINAYHQFKADCVVAEVNQGGDFIEKLLHTSESSKAVRIEQVRATRGKALRADSTLHEYEKQRVYHTQNLFKLEREMCEYDPNSAEFKGAKSPGRIDSLVYAITSLQEGNSAFTPIMHNYSLGIY